MQFSQMAMIFALTLVAWCQPVASAGVAAKSAVTPVQKVLQLMEGMLAKGKDEKHGEQVQFAAFKQFCDDTTVEKKRAIEEANEKIGMLKADIEKYTATAAKLTQEIAEHDEDISVWTGDQKAATKVREIEKADYDALHKDYSESVDALQRAVAVLKKWARVARVAPWIRSNAALPDGVVFALILLALGQPAVSDGVSAKSEVTPVQKVLQLMEGMLAKGKEEKHEEQVQFAAFKQFCDDTKVEKKRAIEEANEKIGMLVADIEKYTATAAQLTKEIAEHDEDISVWTGDQKAATKVREIEKADYDALHKDYSESVDALQRAVAVLKKQSHDRKQAASLVQVSALKDLSLIPDSAKRAIDVFLQEPEGLEVSAPEADGYEFQSHGIVGMLEKLLDEFIAERTKLEKEEMNGKHAYDMLMQDLTAQIAQATQDREEKSEAKSKALQAKADAEGDLKDTTDTRDADQKYLDDLTATCEQKASDFESRQQLRAEEIEAINKAIEIISSGSVAGNAEKHLPSLAQQGASAPALAMLRSDTQNKMAQSRVAQYLSQKSRELNSRVLSALATRVASDPFVKVKKMIKDLLVRLMEEANEEAEHKGWCDTELSTNEQTRKEKTEAVETLHAEIDQLEASIELSTNEQTRKEKTEAVETLHAEIDQLEASIAKLTEDIAELTKAVAELDAAMAEATKLRQEEKARNTQTIADSQEAQTAVAQALTVLKEFYAKAGDATALLQQQPESPEIFDSPYKGMQSENGGVVGMLEVIESDFARLESDTKASEASAQQEYDTFMTDSKVDKESKSKDIEHKPESPEIFDAPYKGMQSENGGVVGMLEVIESDFARLESDTKASEASAQQEYDTFMTDSKVDKESKSKDIEHKTAKKQDEEQALTVKNEDLEGTQKELDAALAYFDKLKPSCVDAGVSFEDRVARRKEEVESLQEALRILNGEDLA
eukprot:CAMPEP_0183484572 /NCGR_PEP_ID=MMETSP0370-20130417/178988_1 /TAXON_ID=268820 /ORGANISM="Peridinium aciculiferum, Strain PAER-2" /LENGTH=950 /DNA_ID=CAMNT_0025677863 /DNA_START=53 /DNA_END=2906 /DNA_ORIENTATION=-